MSHLIDGARFDCLIVGAGPVGCALALALSGSRLRTALIEAGPPRATVTDERGLALSAASLRVLSALGLGPALGPESQPVESILVSDRHGPGVLELEARDADLPLLGAVVTASTLQRELGAAVASLPPERCTLAYETTVEDLAETHEGMRVTLGNAAGSIQVSARLVVLADGGRSPLRARLGFTITRQDYGQSAVVCGLAASRHPGRRALETLTRSGPLAVLPRHNQRVTVVRCVDHAEVARCRALDDAGWLGELAGLLRGRIGTLSSVSTREVWPLVRSLATPAFRPRLLLLGAAERALHPNGAQGFNLGLRDVAGLAEVLRDTAEKGGDPGATATLERYAALRRKDQRAVATLAHGLWWTSTQDFPGASLLRGFGMGLLQLCPGLRRGLVLQAAGLAGAQPRLVRNAA
jgi:2-octaprenyl-6-methoxyphenol hydroxylase